MTSDCLLGGLTGVWVLGAGLEVEKNKWVKVLVGSCSEPGLCGSSHGEDCVGGGVDDGEGGELPLCWGG